MKLKKPIYVIGEGATEKYYFQHLKKLKGYSCVVRPRFFSKKNSIYYLEKQTTNLLSGGVTVICVFDADISERNKAEKERMTNFINEYRNNKNVIICDSLPSIKFWFLLHFKKTNKYFPDYRSIKNELKTHIPNYDKTEKFLVQNQWVKILINHQNNAINNSKTGVCT